MRGAATCAPFDKVDYSRINAEFESWTGPPSLTSLWQAWSQDAEGPAWPAHRGDEPQLRLQVQGNLSGVISTYDLWAVRQAGRWEFRRRLTTLRPPDGPSGRPVEVMGRWEAFTVEPTTVAALERRLGDPCLWSSPPFLDETIPLQGGGESRHNHYPWTFFDLRAGGRQFGGVHAVTIGQPGELMLLMMRAAYPGAQMRGAVAD